MHRLLCNFGDSCYDANIITASLGEGLDPRVSPFRRGVTMARFRRLFPYGLILLLVVCPVLAQEGEQEDAEGASTAEEEGDTEEQFEDTIVVTASRAEQRLHDVPAAMSVITSQDIEAFPSDNYGDFLRNVPGTNVAQFGARDIQITTRGATSSLAANNLVLMDNRSLYLDFFGFVMWDFVPLDPKEIKQMEVVRGPGSAVWGANAMNGVINLITKSPKEMVGTTVTLGGGQFETLLGSVTHAGVSGKLGYKISAAYYEQGKAYDRPTGTIPGTEGPLNPGGTQYPDYENQGTKQPKLNLRFDYDKNDETVWSFTGGWAQTDGIMHSGIGPFDIDQGTGMTFLKIDWTHRAANISLYANLMDGDATNLLTVGVDGQPLGFGFKSDTFNLSYSDTRILGGKHVVSFGANARRNDFDLSIAPAGDNRNEYGIYLQDEILFTDKWRWLVGARWDDIDPIGSVVSPRTTLMFSPTPQHTLRASYNRAFKAPSMIQNYLDITIVNLVNLPTGPYIFPSKALGNPLLQEEQLDAIEVGWVGTFGDKSVSLAAYRNETQDSQDFFTAATYTCEMPPPGWPLPPIFLCIPPPNGLAGLLPAVFSYRNIGEVIDKGVEFGLQWRPSPTWMGYFNLSWQDEPETTGIEPVVLPSGQIVQAVNIPPEWRGNLGASYSGRRFFASGVVNYQADAFWTDVLDSRFWGPTEAFTAVDLTGGVYLAGDKVTLSVSAHNVFDEFVQQHIFGDIIGRKVIGRVILRF